MLVTKDGRDNNVSFDVDVEPILATKLGHYPQWWINLPQYQPLHEDAMDLDKELAHLMISFQCLEQHIHLRIPHLEMVMIQIRHQIEDEAIFKGPWDTNRRSYGDTKDHEHTALWPRRGFTIQSQNHGEHTVKPFNVIRTPAEAKQKFDYIVCAHKAINQDSVPEQLAPVVNQDQTTIVIIQNGVGNEDPFRKAFPKCCILSCVTWVGATQTSPGIVHHTTSEDMQIGLFPTPHLPSQTQQERLATFTALLTHGQTTFQTVPNIQLQRWEKLVWNAAWNSLTTLTMLDTKSWLTSSSDAIFLTRRLMSEVIDVARRCGVPLEYNLTDRLIDKVLAMPVGIGSSMQTDRRNQRPMEVEVILGTPVKRARELGIDTPTLETIYVLLKGIDSSVVGEFR
ncbi:putative ketopantoate reductase family [Phaeomoniella chlamydospora]|uniref:Putative ketopantoate reductase family n=1 Tax=Phaeomoniella chlamydospora TaxID=158046 RepID=A0A0G2EQE6_PHACM|nr:putative ketopantoate reductase family [Phaeomoniella chlamydospora]